MISRHPQVVFHGLCVDRRYEPFDGDAFDVLFAPFERDACSSADILMQAEVRDVPFDRPSKSDVPRFYLGHVQAYEGDDRCTLFDGFSRFDLSWSAPCLHMGVCTKSSVVLPGVTQGMQHLALGLLLREFGFFGIHAGGVCFEDSCLLIVGDCGVGKTTTTLALAEHASGYLGDDRVLLRDAEGSLEVLSYPRELHVHPTTADAFGLRSYLHAGAKTVEGKHDLSPVHMTTPHVHRFRGPVVLLFPSIAAAERSAVRPVNRAEAYGHLLSASAISLVEGVRHGTENLHLIERLANHASAFEVALGQDMLQTPSEAAQRLLDALGVRRT